jgi:hypothetical protein
MESISCLISLLNEVQEPMFNTTERVKIPHNQLEYLSVFEAGYISYNREKIA